MAIAANVSENTYRRFSYGSSCFSHLVKHAAVCIETIFLDKVDPVFTGFQPFGLFFEVVVSISENKGEPSLEPDRFVRVQQRTVPVQTSEVAPFS